MTVLAAVLTGPLLATCSTKENTACPFGAAFGFDALGFGRCEADAQDDAAAFVGRERWASGAGHDMNIAGHRKFVNGVDGLDLWGHNKDMNTTKTRQVDSFGNVSYTISRNGQTIGTVVRACSGYLAELLDGSYIPTGSIKTAVALLEQHAA